MPCIFSTVTSSHSKPMLLLLAKLFNVKKKSVRVFFFSVFLTFEPFENIVHNVLTLCEMCEHYSTGACIPVLLVALTWCAKWTTNKAQYYVYIPFMTSVYLLKHTVYILNISINTNSICARMFTLQKNRLIHSIIWRSKTLHTFPQVEQFAQ